MDLYDETPIDPDIVGDPGGACALLLYPSHGTKAAATPRISCAVLSVPFFYLLIGGGVHDLHCRIDREDISLILHPERKLISARSGSFQ
jgi:hypothetical protein